MRILWVLMVAAVMAAGCSKKPVVLRHHTTVVQPDPAGAQSALKGRLDAALKIMSSEQKDAALQKVAEDAAEARDMAVVKQAIGFIMSSESRDKTAEACALALARQNQTQSAGEIAQMIVGTEARDRTLAAIAKGEKK